MNQKTYFPILRLFLALWLFVFMATPQPAKNFSLNKENHYLSPRSSLSERSSDLTNDALLIHIRIKFLLSQIDVHMQSPEISNWGRATESFVALACALAKRKNWLLIEKEIIPRYKKALESYAFYDVTKANEGLDELGEAIAASGGWEWVEKLWLPLFHSAAKSPYFENSYYIGGVAKGLAVSGGWNAIEAHWVPFVINLLETSDSEVWPGILCHFRGASKGFERLAKDGGLNAVQSQLISIGQKLHLANKKTNGTWGLPVDILVGIAVGLAQRREWKEIEEKILPLYQRTIQSTPQATEHLSELAEVFAKEGGWSAVRDYVLPLYEEALRGHGGYECYKASALFDFETLGDVTEEELIEMKKCLFPLFERSFNISNNIDCHMAAVKALAKFGKYVATQRGWPLLENDIIPLYQQEGLSHKDRLIRKLAFHSSGDLAEGIAMGGGEPKLMTLWLKIFKEMIKDPTDIAYTEALYSYGKIALGMAEWETGYAFIESELLPLFQQYLFNDGEGDENKIGVAMSLGNLAIGVAKAKGWPAVKQQVIPLFSKALAVKEKQCRFMAAENLATLVKVANSSAGWSEIKDQILPLYVRALSDSSFVVRRYALLNADTLFQSADTPSAMEDLEKEFLPLYRQAFFDHEVQEYAIKNSTSYLLALSRSTPVPFIEIQALAQEFLQREDLGSDMESNLMLGISLLSQGYPDKLHDPTETWTKIVALLIRIKNSIKDQQRMTPLMKQFSFLLRDALGRKGAAMNSSMIESLYRNYFKTDTLPKKKQGAKHLLGHILFDFELNRFGLSPEYAKRVRELKRPPSYMAIIPILSQLGDDDDIFRKAIKDFHQCGETLAEDKKSIYFGNVQKLLEILARDRQAFETLNLWDRAKKFLEVPDSPVRNKEKEMQQRVDQVNKLIPDHVQGVFHFKGTSLAATQFSQKEIQVLLFVARNKEYSDEHSLINISLRAYFKARWEGKNKAAATQAFHETLKTMERFNEVASPVELFLDARGTGLKGIEPLFGRIFLSYLNHAAQQRAQQWEDALRHLRELVAKLPAPQWQDLSGILSKIPKNPSSNEVKDHLKVLNLWLTQQREIIHQMDAALYQTIEIHLENVKRFLDEESTKEPASGSLIQIPPFRDVVISIEEDPIEILHLGWPNLGQSCMDLVGGCQQKNAAGYLFHPAVRVVYIRDKNNPEKPLARISVALDPVSRTLFLVSPIKSNEGYDYRRLVEQFLVTWAATLGVTPFLPDNLYKNVSAHSVSTETRNISLCMGLLDFYSDLTGHMNVPWTQKITGIIPKPELLDNASIASSI